MTARDWPVAGRERSRWAAGMAPAPGSRLGERQPTAAGRVSVDRRIAAALWIIVPAAAISALIILGVMLGNGPLTLAGAGLALVAALLAPEVGLAVLVSIAPLQAPPGIPAPGLNLMLVGALLFGCILRLPLDRPRLRLTKSGLFLLGFVVYATAQQMPELLGGYAGDEGHAVGYLFFQLLTGFGTILAAAYILRGRSPLPVLTLALAGAVVATTVAVATFESPVAGPPLGRLVATAEVGLRAAGPFVNPNYMGTFAAAVLVGIVAIWTAVASRTGRALIVGLAILCLVALVQAQSRGALVAGFAGVAAVVWIRSRPLAVALVGAGLVAAVLIYPAFVEWRLTNLRGEVSDAGYVAMTESDDARLQATLAGPAMFLSEPIFGVGFGQFVEKSVEISGLETGINAHNWYVNVLAEQGLTGGLLWLGGTVALAAELRSRRGVGRRVGVGMLATLTSGFLFLEGPTSFQLIAVPSLFLVAALVSDWNDGPSGRVGIGGVAVARGS
jgi:hypothetical protein